MPEDTQRFEVAIVFNGHPDLPPRVVIFKGATGSEAMVKAAAHLEQKTTFRKEGGNLWKGPDGEAVITPHIIEC